MDFKIKNIMKGLSKSKYALFCQCEKALWMRTYHPEEATINPSVEARFVIGNEVTFVKPDTGWI